MTAPGSSPLERYRARLAAAESALASLDRRSARIANGRAATFCLALVLFGLTWLKRLPPWGGWVGLLCLLGFAALVVWHARTSAQEARERIRVRLNQRGVARATGTWRDFEERGERFLSRDHPYAVDLNLFGRGSLFQLLDEAATRGGEERLAELLLKPAPGAEVAERQGAVGELAGALDLRQAFCVEARAHTGAKADLDRFVAWAEARPSLARVAWARPLPFVLPPVTLLLCALAAFAGLSWGWAYLLLAVQALVVGLTRRPLRELFEGLSSGELGLDGLLSALRTVEQHPFVHPRLAALARGLFAEGTRGSEVLRPLVRWYGFAELRRSQLHPALNLLFLWDLLFLFPLERWRKRHGGSIRGAAAALSELDALSCLAGLAHDRPGYTFPEVVGGPAHLEAEALGHPLLDAPVPNDVALGGAVSALVVTGSNMSGKTTFLRCLGVNAVLALAGGPVAARRMSLSGLQVLTSMRVEDSLERGVSYFHAEVQRLRAVLDGARTANGNALVLLDEILMGTNTGERQWASRELVRMMLGTGALLAVATHDLSLTSLSDEPALGVRNAHFVDLVENGRMCFDYRLRDGVVTSTNALRVLRDAGIPIRAP